MSTMLPFRGGHDSLSPYNWGAMKVSAVGALSSMRSKTPPSGRNSSQSNSHSSQISSISSLEDEKMSLGASNSKGSVKVRRTTKSGQYQSSNRGVWADADFQLYISRGDPFSRSGNMNDWALLGFKSARHLSANRLSANSERYPDVLTSLQIFDSSEGSLMKVTEMKDTLKRLDAHKCGVCEWPSAAFEELPRLERLNLSCNSLTEGLIPAELNLSHLVELNLNSNLLTALPQAVLQLHRLHRLYVGFNDISSIKGVEQLRSLAILDLECNSIEYIPWQKMATTLKHLVVLNLKSNLLKTIDKNVKYFRDLTELNLSHNKLTALPAEIFQLKDLKSLDLSHNQIVRLPQLNLSQMAPEVLDLVDLSYNALYKFSDWLLFVAMTVDVTGNSIEIISGTSIKHMSHSTEQRLILRENPIKSPPKSVCLAGLPAIVKYFQEIKTHAILYQGVKVVVMGSKSSGKTSFVQSLADGQSRMTYPDEATRMASISNIDMSINPTQDMPERPFKVCVWDLSGNTFYMNTLHHFIDPNALYIHVFNLANYRTGDFAVNFAQWFNYVIAKNNEIKLLIVGTHADQLQSDTVSRILEEVHQLVQNFFTNFKEKIKKKIVEIENMSHIGAYMQDQLKHYVNTLMNVSVFQFTRVLPISNTEYLGFDKVTQAIKGMITTQKYFPSALRQVPSLWVIIHDTVEDLAKSSRIPIMHIDEFKEELIQAHGMRNMMNDICQYLHETGSIIWLRSNSRLNDFVFLRPRWLVEVIRTIIRPDMDQLEFEELEDLLIPRGIIRPSLLEEERLNSRAKERYKQLQSDVVDSGCYDDDFLKMVISRLAPSNSPKLGLLMQILSAAFEYGYPVERDISGLREDFRLSPSTRFHTSSTKTRRPQSALSTTFEMKESSTISNVGTAVAVEVGATSEIELESESLSKVSKTTASKNQDTNRDGRSMRIELSMPCLLVSCLRKTQQPAKVQVHQDTLHQEKFYKLTAIYVFPVYLPPGFLSRLFARFNQSDYDLLYESHWESGVHARHKKLALSFFITAWSEPIKSTTGDQSTVSYIRLEACNEKQIDFKSVQETWGLFLPLVQDTEAMISDYKGLRTERYVECPQCGKQAFHGEWLAPKDMQQATTVQCQYCQENIRTELLIQPRERKAEDADRVLRELAKRRSQSGTGSKSMLPTLSPSNTNKHHHKRNSVHHQHSSSTRHSKHPHNNVNMPAI